MLFRILSSVLIFFIFFGILFILSKIAAKMPRPYSDTRESSEPKTVDYYGKSGYRTSYFNEFNKKPVIETNKRKKK